MDFILVRVDSRLVHGQILEAWLPHIKATCIVVVDDDVASDFFRESVIKMAVPREIEVLVYGVEEFSQSFAHSDHTDKKAIVLFSTIENALKSFRSGFRFDKLNIGNVYSENFQLRCAPSIQLSNQDIDYIQAFTESGVAVEFRCVPKDKSLDSRKVLKKKKLKPTSVS